MNARELGREMFESTTDVSEVGTDEIITRDAKEYEVQGGQTICIAQVEVIGSGLLERKDELLDGAPARAGGARLPRLCADGHRRAHQGHPAARGR